MSIFGEEEKAGGGSAKKIDVYLEWKGSDSAGFFSYWDKEKEENIKYNFATAQGDKEQFIVLKKAYAVRGFDVGLKCRIYSNIVEDLSKDLTVKAGETTLYKGEYSAIKEDLKADGKAKLHYVITALVANQVVTFGLKGTAFSKLVDIFKEANSNLFKIGLGEVESGKAGAIAYKVPTFIKGDEINKEEKEHAILVAAELRGEEETEIENTNINIEDVPF